MKHRNDKNPLNTLLNKWWIKRQVKQLSLSAIDVEFVEKTVVDCLVEIREAETAEDVYEKAELFPNECLLAISNEHVNASDDHKHMCAVSICELVAMLLLFQGDYRQRTASAILLANANKIYNRDGIIEEIWKHIRGEEEATSLKKWVQELFEADSGSALDSDSADLGDKTELTEDSLLAAYIKDREVRKLVIGAVKNCKKNGETAAMMVQILEEHGIATRQLTNKPFCRALMLHLPYNTTVNALYQAFYRL